jgi:hypothetical protein
VAPNRFPSNPGADGQGGHGWKSRCRDGTKAHAHQNVPLGKQKANVFGGPKSEIHLTALPPGTYTAPLFSNQLNANPLPLSANPTVYRSHRFDSFQLQGVTLPKSRFKTRTAPSSSTAVYTCSRPSTLTRSTDRAPARSLRLVCAIAFRPELSSGLKIAAAPHIVCASTMVCCGSCQSVLTTVSFS